MRCTEAGLAPAIMSRLAVEWRRSWNRIGRTTAQNLQGAPRSFPRARSPHVACAAELIPARFQDVSARRRRGRVPPAVDPRHEFAHASVRPLLARPDLEDLHPNAPALLREDAIGHVDLERELVPSVRDLPRKQVRRPP